MLLLRGRSTRRYMRCRSLRAFTRGQHASTAAAQRACADAAPAQCALVGGQLCSAQAQRQGSGAAPAHGGCAAQGAGKTEQRCRSPRSGTGAEQQQRRVGREQELQMQSYPTAASAAHVPGEPRWSGSAAPEHQHLALLLQPHARSCICRADAVRRRTRFGLQNQSQSTRLRLRHRSAAAAPVRAPLPDAAARLAACRCRASALCGRQQPASWCHVWLTRSPRRALCWCSDAAATLTSRCAALRQHSSTWGAALHAAGCSVRR